MWTYRLTYVWETYLHNIFIKKIATPFIYIGENKAEVIIKAVKQILKGITNNNINRITNFCKYINQKLT